MLIKENCVIFPEQHVVVMQVNDPNMLRQIQYVPRVSAEIKDGVAYLAYPWTEETCRLLSNCGADMTDATPFLAAPHPLVEGKYNAMQHQLMTASFICIHPRCYVLSDPRTGKTGSLILAMDYLQRMRYVTGAFLIITTVTTIHGVWKDSIEGSLPGAKVVVVNGKNREKALEEPADFYITNYDSVRISLNAFLKAADEKRIGGCVIDELTHVGNPSSQRHKAIDKLVNGRALQYVIGVTGSPGNNPDTVFGMGRMINRARLPVQTKTGWINLTTFQWGVERFQRSLKAEAPQIMHDALQPAIRFNKKDIIDLPPVTTQNRECDLSKEQRDMREQFKAEAIAMTESGVTITAANGGVLYGKMLQVAQGFCMDNDGNPVKLDCKDRVSTIVDCIEETDRKVLIFGCYKFSNKQLAEAIEQAGYSCAIIDGDVPGIKRAEILKNFQETPDPKVIVAHPTTMAYGVEASAADTIIFNGPPPLGGFIYAQALERLSSAKQTASNINIIRIIASPEERRGFAQLDAGQDMGNFVSSLFEDYARGML